MGGSAGSSFRGRLDEIAIYRTVLTDEAIKARTSGLVVKPAVVKAPAIKLEDLPKGLVRVEVFEHGVSEAEVSAANWTSNDSEVSKNSAGAEASWSNVPATKTESWNEQPSPSRS